MGEDKAWRIIEYRNEHGPIKNWMELGEDPGLREIKSWPAKKGSRSGNTAAKSQALDRTDYQQGISLLTHLPPRLTMNLRHFLQPMTGFILPKTVTVFSAKQVGQLHE